jgi:hypothetical protein
LIGEGEHALGRQVVDHVEVAVDHLDEPAVERRD